MSGYSCVVALSIVEESIYPFEVERVLAFL
jgi:hypothetical protein